MGSTPSFQRKIDRKTSQNSLACVMRARLLSACSCRRARSLRRGQELSGGLADRRVLWRPTERGLQLLISHHHQVGAPQSQYRSHVTHGGLYAPSEVDRILCRAQYTNSRCSLVAVTMCIPPRAKSSLSVTRCAAGDARTCGVRKFVEMVYASD